MIRKAVIPCAGLGTRMLPYSAAVPKELLPLGNVPTFHYVLHEAACAGIETVVVVNADWKSALDNYLSPSATLLESLERSGKSELIASLLALQEKLDLVSVRQDQSLGLGHAIACAAPVIGDEPFAVLLPDELILQTPTLLADLVAASSNEVGAIGVLEVPDQDVSRYGIVDFADDDAKTVAGLIEKPSTTEAPSNWAIVGRYVFPAKYQSVLRDLKPGAGGELQLTDAMRDNLTTYPLRGIAVQGRRFDTGNLESYRATWNAYLQEPDVFETFLQS